LACSSSPSSIPSRPQGDCPKNLTDTLDRSAAGLAARCFDKEDDFLAFAHTFTPPESFEEQIEAFSMTWRVKAFRKCNHASGKQKPSAGRRLDGQFKDFECTAQSKCKNYGS